MILALIAGAAIVGIGYAIYHAITGDGFPPSAGKLGGDKGLRPPR